MALPPILSHHPSEPAVASVDEAAIRRLVFGFYDAVREDALLSPVFNGEIAPDAWPRHLEKMCDFWSNVLLKTHRYDGRPMPAHLRLPDISDAHFTRWLALFRETAARELSPEGAAQAISHAERIAQSFRMGIAFHRGEDTTKLAPL